MIDDFLRIAEELARRDSGAPQYASLRRAVSTAYYALFHAILERFAASLISPDGGDAESYSLVYRTLDHATLKRVFEQDASGAVLGAGVAKIGNVFLHLQTARIMADYDPSEFPFGISQVLELVGQARESSQAMRDLPRGEVLRLAARLIAKRR